MREKENENMARVKSQKSQKRRKAFVRFLPIYILMLPGLIYLFINNYMPLPGLVIAFKQYNAGKGIYGSPWVGLKNFEYLFTTNDAFVITRNTILYNVAFIVINTTLAIAVAIVLSELEGKRKKVYQSAILLPNLLSTVGYNCIVYLATLMGFDKSFYESAKIDGATRWQQIKYITLPLLRPTIIMLTMMAIGRIFYSDFGLFYQVPMNQGALYSTTNTIDTYVYRGLLQMGNVSMSAAAGVYQSIVGFILVLGANLLVRKIDSDSALI